MGYLRNAWLVLFSAICSRVQSSVFGLYFAWIRCCLIISHYLVDDKERANPNTDVTRYDGFQIIIMMYVDVKVYGIWFCRYVILEWVMNSQVLMHSWLTRPAPLHSWLQRLYLVTKRNIVAKLLMSGLWVSLSTAFCMARYIKGYKRD